jgi:hypothetical protein
MPLVARTTLPMSAHLDASVETPDHEANRSSSRTGMGMLATRWSIRHLSTWTLGLVLAMAPAPATADTKPRSVEDPQMNSARSAGRT